MITDTTYIGQLIVESCCRCGVNFGLPSDFRVQRKQDKRSFWCPNGHEQHYVGQTDAERLKVELEREQSRLASARRDADHQREQRQAEERRVRSLRGVITRTKRRVAHGVCPCCKRSFKALYEHMKSQHPDYVKTAAEAPE